MTRHRIGRAALRLYPDDIREVRGEELLGTLLDSGEGSVGEFISQLASVIVTGLAARSRQALSKPLGTIATETFCWAAVVVVALVLFNILASEIRFYGWSRLPFRVVCLGFLLPALTVAIYTRRRARLAGLLGLAWTVWFYAQAPEWEALRLLTAELAPALIGFVLLVMIPRSIPRTGRWLWLLPAGVAALVQLTGLGWPFGVGRLLPVLAALIFLPVQPTFALGTALSVSVAAAPALILNGSRLGLFIALIAITPAALILAGLARRVAARR